jgi:hypothetical protein
MNEGRAALGTRAAAWIDRHMQPANPARTSGLLDSVNGHARGAVSRGRVVIEWIRLP